MPNLRLTRDNISNILPPEKGEIVYWDTKYKGFGLRVRPKSMMYVVQTRVTTCSGTKLVKATIGRHGILTPDKAEAQAKILLGRIACGENPTAKERDERDRAVTLGELYEKYKRLKQLREKTISVYDSAMRRCFSDWLDKPFINITKDMVHKRHVAISNAYGPRGKGEAQANQAMRLLRSLLNFAAATYEDAEGRPLIVENPVRRLSQTRAWNKIPRRQDIIFPEQLKSWYAAVDALENDTIRDYLLFCLFTGLRRSEALKLKWKDVRFDARMFFIPAANVKTGRDHGLPLSDFLYHLLWQRSTVRRIDNEYVFPAREGRGYLQEPKRQIANVIRASGVKFSMHTLRRTFITIAERLDIAYYALKRLLNHSTANDVTAGYIVIDIERLREPIQKVTNFLKEKAEIDCGNPVSAAL